MNDENPMGMPMVRVLDENDKDLFGPCWYWRFPKTTNCFAGGSMEYREGVVRCQMTDWNLPNRIILTEVTPPHRIVRIEEQS